MRANFRRARRSPRSTLDRVPAPVRSRLGSLCEGGWADRAENVLLFGLPGRGKSHVACAIGHELLERGRRVLFGPAGHVVQRLLRAKRELSLEKELKRLDRYEVLILGRHRVHRGRAARRWRCSSRCSRSATSGAA